MTLKKLANLHRPAKVETNMREQKCRNVPWWLLPHVLGADVAVTALVWGCVCAVFERTNLWGSGALLLLTVAAWVCVMVTRLVQTVRGSELRYAAFYRSHFSWLCLLVVCASAAAMWMLFFFIGRGLLAYVPYVILPLLAGAVLPDALTRSFSRAVAFAVACYAPLSFYSVASTPVSLFFSGHLWAIVGVFFLFQLHRFSLYKGRSFSVSCCAFVWLIGLLVFQDASSGSQSFRYFLVMVLACLHGCNWYICRLGREASDALDWPLMGAAAALGAYVFAG